jgi:hypothetical protein
MILPKVTTTLLNQASQRSRIIFQSECSLRPHVASNRPRRLLSERAQVADSLGRLGRKAWHRGLAKTEFLGGWILISGRYPQVFVGGGDRRGLYFLLRRLL